MNNIAQPEYNEALINYRKSILVDHYNNILKHNTKPYCDGFEIVNLSQNGGLKLSFTNTIFAISVTYNQRYQKTNSDHTGNLIRINKALNDLHRQICYKTIKGSITKKSFIQPFLLASIDVAGSKHSFYGEAQLADGPHHHGVIQIHPYAIRLWNEINNKPQWAELACKIPQIETIDVKPLPTMDDLEKWLSYCSKYSHKLVNSSKYSGYLDIVLPEHEDGVFAQLVS